MKTIVTKFKGKEKKELPPGPWDNEPDKKQWLGKATGLPCLIVRTPLGHLCGYVGVYKTHPFYGKDYDNVNTHNYIDVHGGLTFSNKSQKGGKFCYKVEKEEDDDVWWWLGFDCAHVGDLIPSMLELYNKMNIEIPDYHNKDIYRDIDYVTAECEKLAVQLKEIDTAEKKDE